MKNEECLEYMTRLKNHDNFKVIYDGEDFGIYSYNEEKNRYEGCIGHLTMKSMLEIIKGLNDFIKII